jgi:hypothetical protein
VERIVSKAEELGIELEVTLNEEGEFVLAQEVEGETREIATVDDEDNIRFTTSDGEEVEWEAGLIAADSRHFEAGKWLVLQEPDDKLPVFRFDPERGQWQRELEQVEANPERRLKWQDGSLIEIGVWEDAPYYWEEAKVFPIFLESELGEDGYWRLKLAMPLGKDKDTKWMKTFVISWKDNGSKKIPVTVYVNGVFTFYDYGKATYEEILAQMNSGDQIMFRFAHKKGTWSLPAEREAGAKAALKFFELISQGKIPKEELDYVFPYGLLGYFEER